MGTCETLQKVLCKTAEKTMVLKKTTKKLGQWLFIQKHKGLLSPIAHQNRLTTDCRANGKGKPAGFLSVAQESDVFLAWEILPCLTTVKWRIL